MMSKCGGQRNKTHKQQQQNQQNKKLLFVLISVSDTVCDMCDIGCMRDYYYYVIEQDRHADT